MKNMTAYDMVGNEKLDEINSTGLIFRHKKTKARVVVISNDDNNKVFSIGFRTPPADSTGVAHIIEHSVLCGSKKYPAKDPFVELAKGSLNTFLNAMTYPDKTIYPIASCNDKDFQNLMNVYLDAVFYPNIYDKKEIFMQEGWHYDLENENDDIQYNGVVYNEMKGAFSSPEQILYRTIQHSLFPDVSYGTESGGDPECIPDLTYEQFLDFHRRYYHPSNSYIYLYGDMNVEEKLDWIDKEYLCAFDYLDVDSKIKEQKTFDKISEVVLPYSIAENETEIDNTYHSYNMCIGTSLEKELCFAFEILDYVLIGASGAPLKKAIIDAGIAKDVFGGYDADILQPMFSIIAKNSNESKKEEFKKIIRDTIKKIIKDGVDEKALKAAINRYEFKHREADFDRYPKGLIYGIDMFNSWLYDDNVPFMRLELNDTYEYLKEQIGTGYYEKLIEKYLLNNTHSSIVSIVPKSGLTGKLDENLTKKLQKYKESLSEDEVKALVQTTKNLKKYQEEPSTQEELATIPMLERSDMSKEVFEANNEIKVIKNTKVCYHDTFTNGIGYVDLLFDLKNVPKSLTSYVALFAVALGYFDTKNYTYSMLDNEINIATGGIDFSPYICTKNKATDDDYFMKVSIRTLDENITRAFDLVSEMVFCAHYSDEKHLKEIIQETKSRTQMKINSSGHIIAAKRATSYLSKSGMFSEMISGIEYLNFLKDLEDNFDEKKDIIKKIFVKLTNAIFSKENFIVNLTVEKNSYNNYEKEISVFSDKLKEKSEETFSDINIVSECATKDKFVIKKKNEGFKTASKIQYVSRAGNYIENHFKYTGALRVLKVILSYDYLWINVRVKGGAYGAMCSFLKDGSAYFTSYRDPNLAETNEIYEKVVDYIENFDADEKTMTKYIIGAISALDTPLSPFARGERDFSFYYSGFTKEDLQKEREEVLNVTKEDIRALAPLVRSILKDNNFCVIGNENKIENSKTLFMLIKELN